MKTEKKNAKKRTEQIFPNQRREKNDFYVVVAAAASL